MLDESADTGEGFGILDLPEAKAWASGWTLSVGSDDYVLNNVSFTQAWSIARLMWPRFELFNGLVVLGDRRSTEGFEALWKAWDPPSLFQHFANLVHLWDLFTGESQDDVTQSAMTTLAQMMSKTWTLALSEAFPGRDFVVEWAPDGDDYGPTVSFHERTPDDV